MGIDGKYGFVSSLWSPKLVVRLNDYEVKPFKLEDGFVWHTDEDGEEVFPVLEGQLTIQLRARDLVCAPGQLFVVPRGVADCPRGRRGEGADPSRQTHSTPETPMAI